MPHVGVLMPHVGVLMSREALRRFQSWGRGRESGRLRAFEETSVMATTKLMSMAVTL